ncbi:MAG: glycosyltransferase family 1 protein [Parcubacteria group bacterium]|jgi:glycosyltransferase involved in cell wall biosynthesis
MRIGIDARFFGIKQKGLGRYTQKLIENLEKTPSKEVIDYYIFLRKDNFQEYQPTNPRFRKVLADYPWYTFSEQLLFPWLLYRYRLDLVHFPHFNVPIMYSKRFLVTIHDLTLIHFPTVKNSTLHPIFYRIKFFVYKIVIRLAIQRAVAIIAISHFTKKDILDNYGESLANKIKVTYEASEDFCMLSASGGGQVLQKYGIIKPYLIYVGNAYPHKNLDRLVRSFNLVVGGKKDLQLLLIGKNDYFYERLRRLVLSEKIKNILFLSDITDYELDILFHNSLANVFPSLYEGFGLPPLEAMSKGVPVISSDHPCMREILGESAYFFDGKNISSIAQAMNVIIDSGDLRHSLVESGYEQIKKYSWKKMARETLVIYLEHAANPQL